MGGYGGGGVQAHPGAVHPDALGAVAGGGGSGMTAALLNIPPGEAIGFAFTMALVIGFGYVLVTGTGRPR
jgi:hypothetical protein